LLRISFFVSASLSASFIGGDNLSFNPASILMGCLAKNPKTAPEQHIPVAAFCIADMLPFSPLRVRCLPDVNRTPRHIVEPVNPNELINDSVCGLHCICGSFRFVSQSLRGCSFSACPWPFDQGLEQGLEQ
jgi:hypothetical protein